MSPWAEKSTKNSFFQVLSSLYLYLQHSYVSLFIWEIYIHTRERCSVEWGVEYKELSHRLYENNVDTRIGCGDGWETSKSIDGWLGAVYTLNRWQVDGCAIALCLCLCFASGWSTVSTYDIYFRLASAGQHWPALLNWNQINVCSKYYLLLT